MLPIDLITLIKTVGYLGIFAIVFLESGLMIGFFFPGDSLLFTAGFLASVLPVLHHALTDIEIRASLIKRFKK